MSTISFLFGKIFRKINNNKQSENNKKINLTDDEIISYNNIKIVIEFNVEESKKHLVEDYNVLEKEGIDNIIKSQFIPWLKGDQFKDKDVEKVYEGLKLYSITYDYEKIIEEYSPTGKENYFGQFEFCFESMNEYTSDMLEAVSMQIYILDGKIVKVSGYDI